jgi:hypothetical protein
MLALIEQKMSSDDRKVWARDLEREKKEATLENIMKWMTTEMKSRMRASAPLRNQGRTRWNVNHVGHEEHERHKCWLCKTSTHWVDQLYEYYGIIKNRVLYPHTNSMLAMSKHRSKSQHWRSLAQLN